MSKVNLIESPFPLAEIKGLGPKRLSVLNELNIYTVEDLILYLPTRYEDNTVVDLNEAEDQAMVTVVGEVYSTPTVAFFGRNKSKLTVHLMVNNIAVKCVFFNQPYLKKKIELHQTITIKGKWNRNKQEINGNRMFFNQQVIEGAQFEPVYRIKEGIKQKPLRDMIRQVLDHVTIHEWLSKTLRQKYKLETLEDTIKTLHMAPDKKSLLRARRTYAFIELFMFELRMQWLNRLEKTSDEAIEIDYDIHLVKNFIEDLPFELTDAQKQSVNEIFRDLKAPLRMHRLLQGDVGSGKTVVAAICMYALKTAGYQSALMVPTEILAEQHAESLAEIFGDRMNIALLTGSVKGKKRKLLLEQLENNEIDCIIGTHALIQDDVVFNNVGLVITDEQHRFGVNQRQLLREKGAMTNVLFMTATPIPRTLAISVFGEMDVSSIKQLPKGRKPIITSWSKHEAYESVLHQMTVELHKGRQAYVICPLIESSEHLEDVQNVVALFESMQAYYGSNKVGLLHGKLTSEEKDHVMQQFSNHEIDILVSTTVVEVGVNVPNATFMMIYDADRFGLSTLHQLRGRVGRSEQQSYCVLIASPKTETGIERMNIMTQTTDGFELSERDLEMRGPGDFFGVKQSGLPDFLVANVVEDYKMLEVARDEAAELIQSGTFFEPEYERLRTFVENNLLYTSFD
ncbi:MULTISPECIES: ATP-dependent DNA helicase RecG [Staphylococcus]|jgi:ATP-dependent DNA helicase RecG|uniref:ATP-dependent DNA helicase RecG n=1 Tax=Staphylococcus nepalensis TaxID=214473 RepID=A0A291JLT2_9STAP|nr:MULTISPECIES: ATP-dependent DNA helicase RecG [Staphylococcus]ATH60347.1 ATP-dependent DNA helicase RecG [Staphylococcus nepalensis]ATH65396.1 ATP-dependent DNA helicase RecG [Staphylococcus nepalensis]AWI44765.1 ATP-dependent DNA helicase RecG [Staphylococcus nepalensis]MBO1204724.1 ATP-dependent DNA helicase RecG [Staphylococcus nepalensis]MBO1220551.1 ATP-dependent DNA helicase RecG [Staphylococcus nepalensis]